MSINLIKQAPPSPAQISAPSIDPQQMLRTVVAMRVFDAYCDSALRTEMIRLGVSNHGLDLHMATMIVDMELEVTLSANEQSLIEELDGLLRRFTNVDKKLDTKERSDAIQMVCKPKTGYSKGLSFEIAQKRVVTFCRANGVKVKVGFLRWDIP